MCCVAVNSIVCASQGNGGQFSRRKQVKMNRQGASQQTCVLPLRPRHIDPAVLHFVPPACIPSCSALFSCSSWFLQERAPWMPDLSEREGKLCCPAPKCGAKVTTIAFAGSRHFQTL